MLTTIWGFLQDESNRTVLAWIGGGMVVVAGGLWTVIRFLMSKKEKGESASAPNVTASHGGVAVGRDIQGSKIDTRGGGTSR
jgi:hypothetical protein